MEGKEKTTDDTDNTNWQDRGSLSKTGNNDTCYIEASHVGSTRCKRKSVICPAIIYAFALSRATVNYMK